MDHDEDKMNLMRDIYDIGYQNAEAARSRRSDDDLDMTKMVLREQEYFATELHDVIRELGQLGCDPRMLAREGGIALTVRALVGEVVGLRADRDRMAWLASGVGYFLFDSLCGVDLHEKAHEIAAKEAGPDAEAGSHEYLEALRFAIDQGIAEDELRADPPSGPEVTL